jgi:hypothetical protein
MYIHIYTIYTDTTQRPFTGTITNTADIDVYWYIQETDGLELFRDYAYVLSKLRDYKQINSYSGTIIEIDDIDIFTEQLLLFGVNIPATTFDIKLQDKSILKINHGLLKKKYTYITKPSDHSEGEIPIDRQIEELFTYCFGGYNVCSTFTSNNILSAYKNTFSEFIRVQNMKGEYIFIKGVELARLDYSLLKTNTSNTAMASWFTHVCKNMTYTSAVIYLEKVFEHNTELNKKIEKELDTYIDEQEDNEIEEQEKEITSDNKPIITLQGFQEKKDIEWITDFCRLYAEPDAKSDTLLSDAYQQYITSSSWTKERTVNMQLFIKQIKQIPEFNVKRKAKGMVIAGYRFLVNDQEEMFNKTKKGELSERNLLVYMHNTQIENLVKGVPEEFIGVSFYLESKILLNKAINMSDNMVEQFINNPYIKQSLPDFSKYLKELKGIGGFENRIELFRKVSQKCALFCPFSSQIFKFAKIVKSTKDIQYKNMTIIEPFDPFNYKIDSVYGNVNDYNGETDIKNILAGFDKY